MSFTPESDVSYSLDDVATSLHYASPDDYVILTSSVREGMVSYHKVLVTSDLEPFLDDLQSEVSRDRVYNVKYPEDGTTDGSLAFTSGQPDQNLLETYQIIDHDGPVTQVFGYSLRLRQMLQPIYEREARYREESHPVCIKESCLKQVRKEKRRRERQEREDYPDRVPSKRRRT